MASTEIFNDYLHGRCCRVEYYLAIFFLMAKKRNPNRNSQNLGQGGIRNTRPTKTAPRRRRKRKPRRIIGLLLFASGFLLGSLLPTDHGQVVSRVKNAAYELDPAIFNRKRVIVLGTDQSSGSTDVMFTVESDGEKTVIQQIPRDTMVQSERFGIVKANSLYTLGGPVEVEKEVSRLVNRKIEHFARVNLEGVSRIITVLDGVEVNVPFRMKYDDYTQKLHIDIYPGKQILKGSALEGYIRFRNDGLGDVGRTERQQAVYKALFKKVMGADSIMHLPELISIAHDDIKTDLSPIEIGALLGLMKGNQLKIIRLEGRAIMYKDLSYWLPNGEQLPL